MELSGNIPYPADLNIVDCLGTKVDTVTGRAQTVMILRLTGEAYRRTRKAWRRARSAEPMSDELQVVQWRTDGRVIGWKREMCARMIAGRL